MIHPATNGPATSMVLTKAQLKKGYMDGETKRKYVVTRTLPDGKHFVVQPIPVKVAPDAFGEMG